MSAGASAIPEDDDADDSDDGEFAALLKQHSDSSCEHRVITLENLIWPTHTELCTKTRHVDFIKKKGHLDAPSHPPMLGHVGAMLDHFGILLGDLMAMLKHFGAMSGHLGAMLGHLGPPLGYLGAMLDHLGALLDYLEAILSLIMTWLGHPGVILVQTGLEDEQWLEPPVHVLQP